MLLEIQITPNPKLEKLLSAEGHGIRIVPNNKGVTHPFSAAYRTLAIHDFLIRAGVKRFSLKIADWFGSRRNERILPKLPHLTLEWISCPPRLFQGDAARGFYRSCLPSNFDTFLVQDVYQDGYTYDTALTPLTLKNLVMLSAMNKGFVISRYFDGYAGMDSQDYNEGCWVRDLKSNLINFSPDPVS